MSLSLNLGISGGCGSPSSFGGGILETIPQKFIITPETHLEEFETTAGWAVAGTASLNTTQKLFGDASLKLTSASGVVASIEKVVDWDFSADNGKSFRLRMFPNSAPTTTFTSIYIYAGDSAALSNRFRANINATSIFAGEWNMLWNLTWTTDLGSPSWANINYVRIRVNTVAGQVSECSFDLASSNELQRPAIAITFDDGNESVFSKALPLLLARKQVATAYVIPTIIGDANILSLANLLEMQSKGWVIGNHTYNHTTLTTLNSEQITEELELARVWLESNGLPKGSRHVAYPQGSYNDTVIAAMGAWGAKTGRLSNNRVPTNWEVSFPYKIAMVTPFNVTTVAAAKAWIDSIKVARSVGFMNFHDIVDANANSSTQYLTANFIEILDYINAQGVLTVTIDDYHNSYYGPVKIKKR